MNFSFRSTAFMFLVTFAFTALVSGVKSLSDPRIRVNRETKRQSIILQVLGIPIPEDVGTAGLPAFFRGRVREIQIGDRLLFQGLEADGVTVRGYAFPVGGAGFWGPISGMAAVDPRVTRLLGLAFISHSETPGLGGRISEAWFTNQFRGLALSPGGPDGRIFTLGPADEAGETPGRLDAVTGATNTSAAVEDFLNRDLNRFLRETAGELRTR
jgi:Na+-transporting NADH:ubiquinone oxidoreductase subunit C